MLVKNSRQKQRQFLILFLVLISILAFRLLLINKGHFHLQDELRYRYTFALIRELINFRPISAAEQLFQFPLYARPGLVLFNIPTAILQVAWLVFTGVKTEAPMSLTIASGVQVIVSVASSFLIFKISKRYLTFYFSLATVVVYSLLINTNLYLRHILPYDTTLFVYLLVLWFILSRYKNSFRLKDSLVIGLVVGFLHLVYPAFYLFSLVIGFLVAFLPKRGWWRRGIVFSFSFGLMLLLAELSSRALGYSFWRDTKFLISRVVVGNSLETPIFIFKYLAQVEGAIGILLLIIFSLFAIGFLVSPKQYSREFRLLSWAMMGSYSLHGLSGPISGKVFYGRSIHMYFWFVVLASLIFLQKIVKKKFRPLIILMLVSASLLSFTGWYPKYLNLDYPGDVLYKFCQTKCSKYGSFVNENNDLDHPTNRLIDEPEFLTINFERYFFPEDKVYTYGDLGGQLIFQSPHPVNFVAYQFEALTPAERKIMQERNYQMKLYRQ